MFNEFSRMVDRERGVKAAYHLAFALIAGVVLGAIFNLMLTSAAIASVARYGEIVTKGFLGLIKTIVGPLVLCSVVSGIVTLRDTRRMGRVIPRVLAWFVGTSLLSLALGLTVADLAEPGIGAAVPAAGGTLASLHTESLNAHDFLLSIFPVSLFDALARTSMLPIIVCALIFGLAIRNTAHINATERFFREGALAMLTATRYVMALAPLAVFAGVTMTVAQQGLSILMSYARLLLWFGLTAAILFVLLRALAVAFIGKGVLQLIRSVRPHALLAATCASSEGAFPGIVQTLARWGVQREVTDVVLPLAYAFDLAGSMVYQTFAVIFLAQVFHVHLGLWQQIAMFPMMMVASKGTAGVPRSSLVVIATVAPMFGIPETAVCILFGVDHLLDMVRSGLNVYGVTLATAFASHVAERQRAADLATAEIEAGPVIDLDATTTRLDTSFPDTEPASS